MSGATIEHIHTPSDTMLDMLETMREQVKRGECRWLHISAIDMDNCTRSAEAGNATYIEKIGLLALSTDIIKGYEE